MGFYEQLFEPGAVGSPVVDGQVVRPQEALSEDLAGQIAAGTIDPATVSRLQFFQQAEAARAYKPTSREIEGIGQEIARRRELGQPTVPESENIRAIHESIARERHREMLMGLGALSKMRSFFGLDFQAEVPQRWFTKGEDKQLNFFISQRKQQYLQMYPEMGIYQAAQAALGDARQAFPHIHPDALAASLGEPYAESAGGKPPAYHGAHISAYFGAQMDAGIAERRMSQPEFHATLRTVREYRDYARARGERPSGAGLATYAFDDYLAQTNPATDVSFTASEASAQLRKAAPDLSLAAARLGIF